MLFYDIVDSGKCLICFVSEFSYHISSLESSRSIYAEWCWKPLCEGTEIGKKNVFMHHDRI